MAEVGNLTAKLTLDTIGFDKGIGGVESSVSKLAGGIGKALGGVTAAVGAAVGAAATGVAALVKESVASFGEYEQLVGGAQKIFDQMDYSTIAADAADAWQTMNLSASQYLSMINNVGATFAQTMGDQKGYEVAKRGMQAIADYASGTGKDVGTLNEKFAMITRSATSYQSIADQFSGILPQTSAEFLKQAQAAGLLETKYKDLTKVPVAEYQEAVVAMLEKGVEGLGLAGNTADETMKTITGSIAGLKAAWSNLVTGMASGEDLQPLIDNVVKMGEAVIKNILPAVSQALSGVAQLIKNIAPVIAAELPGLIEEVAPMLIEAAMTIVMSLTQALPELIDSLMQSVSDILPQIAETVVTLLDVLVATIIPALLQLAGQLVLELATALLDNIDQLAETAMTLITGFIDFMIEALPTLITVAVEIVSHLATYIAENAPIIINGIIILLQTLILCLIENLPLLLEAGLTILMGLVDGLIQNIWMITDAVVIIIKALIQTIMENLPMILVAALEIGAKIVAGIVAAIPNLIISVGKMLGIIDDTKSQMDTHANKMQSSVNATTTGINTDIDNMVNNLNAKTQAAKDSLSSTSSYAGNVKDDMNKKADDLQKTAVKVQKTTIQSYETISGVISHARASLQTSFEKMEEMIQGLILKFEKLGAVNAAPSVDASGVVEGCEAIVAAVERASEALNGLNSASGGGGGGFGGGHASGGYMSAGTTYLVGELGPELITPTRSGYVHTADETADMLGGGQSINITIAGDVYDDERSMRIKLKDAMLSVLQEQMAYG